MDPSDTLEPGDTENREPTAINTDDSKSLRTLSAWNAFTIIISLQLGSGIFASPSQVDNNVPSPGIALLTWIGVGFMSWAGAASFAELGTALPRNGGMQEYLRHMYGDGAAFLMCWNWILAVKPSSMAVQSIVLVESLASILTPNIQNPMTQWKFKCLAITILLLVVAVNSISTRASTNLSNYFTLIKLGAVAAFGIGGLSVVIKHFSVPDATLPSNDWYTKNWFSTRKTMSGGVPVDWDDISWLDILGHYSAAIYAGLWAYAGWDNSNFVASEIREPRRFLPLAIHSAMITIIFSFEILNLSYYLILPWDSLSSTNTVAVSAAKALLGTPAGAAVAIFVSLSCAGSINSLVFVTGRLTVAASQRKYLPEYLSKAGLPWSSNPSNQIYSSMSDNNTFSEHESQSLLQQRSDEDPNTVDETTPLATTAKSKSDIVTGATWRTPINAMLFNFTVAAVYIVTGSFSALLTFAGMAEYCFFFLTIVGLVSMRTNRSSSSNLELPYKTPLFVPIAFCAISGAVLTYSVFFAPVQALVIAIILVGGWIVGRYRR